MAGGQRQPNGGRSDRNFKVEAFVIDCPTLVIYYWLDVGKRDCTLATRGNKEDSFEDRGLLWRIRDLRTFTYILNIHS